MLASLRLDPLHQPPSPETSRPSKLVSPSATAATLQTAAVLNPGLPRPHKPVLSILGSLSATVATRLTVAALNPDPLRHLKLAMSMPRKAMRLLM